MDADSADGEVRRRRDRAPRRGSSPPPREPWWLRPLHLFCLASLAISQPLFDLMARQSEFLVAHEVQPSDLLVLAFTLGVLVPSVPALVVGISSLAVPRIGGSLFAALFVVLVVCTAVPWLERAQLPGVLQVLAAFVLGTAALLAYRRWPPLRTYLTLLAPASLIFPTIFLLSSPVQKLLLQEPVAVAPPSAATNGASPVLIVVFDEFPVATSTTWAVPAILTGRYPRRWLQATAQDYPENLFTALGGSYDQFSFEPITQICPPELSFFQ